MLFTLSMGDFEWRTDMTEVVLDVKLASLGVLNISPRGLTDITKDFDYWCNRSQILLRENEREKIVNPCRQGTLILNMGASRKPNEAAKTKSLFLW